VTPIFYKLRQNTGLSRQRSHRKRCRHPKRCGGHDADKRYGFNDLLSDVMAEPFRKSVEKSVEDVLNEFLSGKYPSIDFDFGHLWVRAMTALGSTVSGGLAFAGIRFLFTVLLRKTEQPEFCRLMEVAKDVTRLPLLVSLRSTFLYYESTSCSSRISTTLAIASVRTDGLVLANSGIKASTIFSAVALRCSSS
jgi:hypothetical protein